MGFDTFEKVRDFVYKCKTCGQEVSSGIVSISGHWSECTGNFFTQELMKKAEETKGKLTPLDIAELQERCL